MLSSLDKEMDTEAGRTMEIAALGRPFSLGMLYDCRQDVVIPGKDSQVLTKFNWTIIHIYITSVNKQFTSLDKWNIYSDSNIWKINTFVLISIIVNWCYTLLMQYNVAFLFFTLEVPLRSNLGDQASTAVAQTQNIL